jgi:hypothetical protein
MKHISACAMYTMYTSKSRKAHNVSSQVYISYCRATSIQNCSIAYYINHVALHVLHVNRYCVANRIYIFVYMCICMCMCIYIYMYIYIYTHIYVYIFVNMYMDSLDKYLSEYRRQIHDIQTHITLAREVNE